MAENQNQWLSQYDEMGYFVVRNYFTAKEIVALRSVILTFHQLWQQDNETFYQEDAFNSSLITGSEYLSPDGDGNQDALRRPGLDLRSYRSGRG